MIEGDRLKAFRLRYESVSCLVNFLVVCLLPLFLCVHRFFGISFVLTEKSMKQNTILRFSHFGCFVVVVVDVVVAVVTEH